MALWTPTEVTTSVWLDAADASTIASTGNNVDSWTDKSNSPIGSFANTGTNRPTTGVNTQNGKNVINFDVSNLQCLIGDDWLDDVWCAGPGNSFTVFLVVKKTSSGGAHIFTKTGFTDGTRQWRVGIRDDYSFPRYFQETNFVNQLSRFSGNGGSSQVNLNTYYISQYTYTDSGETGTTCTPVRDKMYLNGTLETVSNLFCSGSFGTLVNTAAKLSVGCNRGITDGPSGHFDGDMAEIVVLPNDPSDSTRQKIEGYLAHKWGLEADLPVDHPYKAAAPLAPTLPGGALWTPEVITTNLWLDAAASETITESGGLVSQWDDRSDNARNGTQTGTARPTYLATGLNGNPALDFDGSNDDLVLTNTLGLDSVNQSLFIVAQRDNAAGRTEVTFAVGQRSTGDGVSDLPRWTDNNMYSQVGYVSNRPSPASVITNNPYINCVTGGAIQEVYTNGTSIGTGTTQSLANFSVEDGGYVGSGRAVSGLNRYFDGKISEVIILPEVATTETRQKIEGYLAHKWGLEADLPADHPYKNSAPTIPVEEVAASLAYSSSFNGIIQVITNVIETVSGVGTTSYTINPNGYANNFGGVVEALSDLNETASGLGFAPFTYAPNGYSNNFKGVIEVLSDFNQTMSGVNNTSGYASNFGGIVSLASDVVETVSGVGTTSFAINPSGYASNFGGVVEVLSDLNTTISGV